MAKSKKSSKETESDAAIVVSKKGQGKENEPANEQVNFGSRNAKDRIAIKKKPQTLSKKAGLVLPAIKVLKALKRGSYADVIQKGAAVYCTAVLEYLAAEVLEISADAAHDNKKRRIIPRHITLAIRNDHELDKLLSGVTISEGGVLPNIHSVLLPKKSKHRSL
jgi:histone H2A